MRNPVGRASDGLILPLLKAASDNAAISNWISLDHSLKSAGTANGRVMLPAGPFFFENTKLGAVTIDERHAFVTVQGAGRDKTALISSGTHPIISVASRLVRVEGEDTFSASGTEITLSDPADIVKY